MKKQRFGQILFWIGLVIAIVMAGFGTQCLMSNLRYSTLAEVETTAWSLNGPLFKFWAFSVPLGSLLAMIGAFSQVKTKPLFSIIASIVILGLVVLMNIVWSRIYIPLLFGIGGVLILLFFFAIVWIWMKKYGPHSPQEKAAGRYKLIGYIFWFQASWFLCGETGKLHLKAFSESPLPSPIEIMVFLVLGWLFVLIGDYMESRLKK